MIVEVTQEDIEQGTPCSSSNCAMARAVKRAYPGKQVVVLAGSIRLIVVVNGYDEAEASVEKFTLPFEASAFISKFDRQQPVKPQTFVCKED